MIKLSHSTETRVDFCWDFSLKPLKFQSRVAAIIIYYLSSVIRLKQTTIAVSMLKVISLAHFNADGYNLFTMKTE